MKLTRRTVESASDVVGYGMVTRIVEVPQIQYIDIVVDVQVCVEDGDLHSLERLVCSRSP